MSQFNNKNSHLVVGESILFQLVMWINFIPVSSIWQILYSDFSALAYETVNPALNTPNKFRGPTFLENL